MKECKSLGIEDKLVLRTKPDTKIYYVNDDFVKFTGFEADSVLLKELHEVIPDTMPELFKEILLAHLKDDEPSYYVIKGKTNKGYCYWGLMRVTTFQSKLNNEFRYLVEIKMLPTNAVLEGEKVFDTVEKVYENAGAEFAKKYFEGFLEEKNQTFEEFILSILGVNKKKLEKYFKI